MTQKEFNEIINDLQKSRAKETKHRAVEMMQQELISKIIELHNAKGLAEILVKLQNENEYIGTISFYRRFLRKALEEKGVTKEEEQQDYFIENAEVLDDDWEY